jgi:hypothetical protein
MVLPVNPALTPAEQFAHEAVALVADAVPAALAEAVRARLSFTRYALYDRGSYEVAESVDEPALFAALAALASNAVGQPLAVREARALRLRAGDYLLAHHDRVLAERPIEAVLDLSPAAVPGAELHYRRRGKVFFRMPCAPRSLAIVDRTPLVTCNHVYVSRQHASADVIRLVALLTTS